MANAAFVKHTSEQVLRITMPLQAASSASSFCNDTLQDTQLKTHQAVLTIFIGFNQCLRWGGMRRDGILFLFEKPRNHPSAF
jgi:hypothetical protein